MPSKTKATNKITDIKPVKVGVNGDDHLLDDTENQNLDKPIVNDAEENSESKLNTLSEPETEPNNSESAPDDKHVDLNDPSQPEPKRTVAGTKVIAPLKKTDSEIEQVNNQPIQPATTDVAENNEINYEHPDSSQKMASNLAENMQSPKIFDTKEYHLPISQSKHSHGFLIGSVVAGLIFATIVAGLALVVLNNLNK